MIFHQIEAGGDRNFAYLMADGERGTAALFDPPPDASRYLPLVEEHGLEVAYIIVTHGHGDHTWGLSEAKKRAGGPDRRSPREPRGCGDPCRATATRSGLEP